MNHHSRLRDALHASHLSREQDDCIVLALTMVTWNSYTLVHQSVRKMLKREDRDGVRYDLEELYATVGNLGCVCRMVPLKMFEGQLTLSNMDKKLPPRGTYLAEASDHIVAHIDGVTYDSGEPSRKHVRFLYLIEKRY